MEALLTYAPMLLILVVFYAMILIPDRKRKKNYEAMIQGLKLNDEVMTRGGVIGKIISLDDDNVVLESGPDRVRLRFSKNAIANKIYKESK
ncbi:MAG: preprotein translocase subunit YajC [Clostridium sp.]|nr:preprotein translocase subunit YajC [Clostridium sp.]